MTLRRMTIRRRMTLRRKMAIRRMTLRNENDIKEKCDHNKENYLINTTLWYPNEELRSCVKVEVDVLGSRP